MEVYLGNHVDIYNNSVVLNNRCPVSGSACGNVNWGQVLGLQATDVNIYNNILLSPKGKFTYVSLANVGLSEGHNVMYGWNGGVTLKPYNTLNASDIVQSPLFADLSTLQESSFSSPTDLKNVADPALAIQALSILKRSPARNSGTNVLDNGAPMLVTPEAMNGNLDTALDVGALSFPNSTK